MITLSTIQDIKVMQAQGYSVSAIAEHLHIDRKTVRKYMQQMDFSLPVPLVTPRPSKLDPYKAVIDGWLEEDTHQWYKQRHTAQRVFDRLTEEFPEWTGSYRTVRRYVQGRRRTAPVTGTLDLVWHPAEAQVDFGQADVVEQGERVRMHFLCLTFPYSFPCCSAAPRRMKNGRICQVDRSPRQVLASALSNTLGRSHGEVDISVVLRGRPIV